MTTRPPPRRGLPWSPALAGTAVLHAGAAAGTALQPALWPWAVGAVAANHALLTAAGLWPRSRLLGPNWTRLPPEDGRSRTAIALTIDDGPDPAVTPRVLEQLARRRARATFFCVGERVERFPDLARDILRQGHGIENHSHSHSRAFSLLGPRGMLAEVAAAQAAIARVTGTAPVFFRAPAGLRNPFLEPVLTQVGLRLASWTRRGFDTVEADADVVFRRLTRRLGGGDILLLHDGNAARTGAGVPVVLDVLPRLLEMLRERDLHTVTLREMLQ